MSGNLSEVVRGETCARDSPDHLACDISRDALGSSPCSEDAVRGEIGALSVSCARAWCARGV